MPWVGPCGRQVPLQGCFRALVWKREAQLCCLDKRLVIADIVRICRSGEEVGTLQPSPAPVLGYAVLFYLLSCLSRWRMLKLIPDVRLYP